MINIQHVFSHLFSPPLHKSSKHFTDDLMSYFRDYGPSYVEWLGELSCNVLFEDKHSAARAFHALSQELPSPPPESLTNPQPPAGDSQDTPVFEEMKDRWTNINDEDEDAENKEETMDSTNDDNDKDKDGAEGAAIDDSQKDKKDEDEPLPDFGGLGWRFCKWTVRKVSSWTFFILFHIISGTQPLH